MRRLTALILATALATTWSAAVRADEEGSLLRCGVQLGGSELAYRPDSTATRRAGAGSLRTAAPDPSAAQEALFVEPPRIDFQFREARANRRLPAVLAIARVGCSWR